MIIGLCGRLGSGKTELSRICEENGYRRLYFALPLKILISHLLDTDIDGVNSLKTANFELKLTDEQLEFISHETDITFEDVKENLENIVFHNSREMLQVIGTDLIRKFNNNWHVNKIKNMIDSSQDYVIDDVRFLNEKEMIEEMGGKLVFIVRPYLSTISNHESERTLRWQMFDFVVINNNTIEQLKFIWDTFLKNGFSKSLTMRTQLINRLLEDKDELKQYIEHCNEMNMYNMFLISPYLFNYNDDFLVNIKKIEKFDSYFCVYYNDDSIEKITHPLMVEDLKFYC